MKRSPPDARAVARRAIALRHLAGFALSTIDDARRDRDQRLAELGAWQRCFTRRERAIYRSPADELTERDRIDASWRTEAVHVLAWALRAEPALLAYDRQARLRNYRNFATGDLETFVKRARLRPQRELEAARDLAEFWHWRSRTRQLQEGSNHYEPDARDLARGVRSYDDIARLAVANALRRGELRPSQVKAGDFKARNKAYRDLSDDEWSEVRSITRERHFALNWLCGYAPRNQWESTPTDT